MLDVLEAEGFVYRVNGGPPLHTFCGARITYDAAGLGCPRCRVMLRTKAQLGLKH